jgi:hypothetical protein
MLCKARGNEGDYAPFRFGIRNAHMSGQENDALNAVPDSSASKYRPEAQSNQSA